MNHHASSPSGIPATSRPNDGTRALVQAKGLRVVPVIRPYRVHYPALWCELSYRYGITDGGKLTPERRRLFKR